MNVTLEFQSIDHPEQQASVTINGPALGSGAQGSVFPARLYNAELRCVKVLSGVSAGEVRNELAMLQRLRCRTAEQLGNPAVQGAIRENIEALRRYLPDYVSFAKLPGYDRAELLLSRPYCSGTPLHELLSDSYYETRDVEWRLQLAKKVCRLLVAMELFGLVHLDAYPDNILVEDPESSNRMKAAMIDLEGVGVLAVGDAQGDGKPRWLEEFERTPRSFFKDDFWILPWWFPVPGKTNALSDWFIHASRYQMLALVFLTLTWGSTPGCWLSREALYELQILAEQVRIAGRTPTASERSTMSDCLHHIDLDVVDELTSRCGSIALVNQAVAWFQMGFLGPDGRSWRWFHARELQVLLNSTGAME